MAMESELVMLHQFSLDDDIAKNVISFRDVPQTVGCAVIHTLSHLLNSHHFVHYLSHLICLIRVILLMIGAITRRSSPIQISDGG